MNAPEVEIVEVFVSEKGGGNPAPIMLDARGLGDADMLSIARAHNLESGFVLPATDTARADCRFRFFVPQHEMEMCGHATIGALWLMRRRGLWTGECTRVETRSGIVQGFVREAGSARETIEITQPVGRLSEIADPALAQAVLDVLGISRGDTLELPLLNASTSRPKTLVPLRSSAILDALKPDFSQIAPLCEQLGSTGLYPFAAAPDSENTFEARQFPKSSGYPEDAATGIAAAALAFGLRTYGLVPRVDREIIVRQGRAMGRPSEIRVRFDLDSATGQPRGCLLGGRVVLARQPIF